jgi:hypothetical protein
MTSATYAYNNVPLGVQFALSPTIGIPNLPFTTYATDSGYWTNTANVARKFNISHMTSIAADTGTVNIATAAIWFQKQATFTGATSTDRYGQMLVTNTGNTHAVLSSTWTFVLQPNETLAFYGYCVNTAGTGNLNVGDPVFGMTNGYARRVTITELL